MIAATLRLLALLVWCFVVAFAHDDLDPALGADDECLAADSSRCSLSALQRGHKARHMLESERLAGNGRNCSENARCAGMEGECCPTAEGVMLGCCEDLSKTLAAEPKMVACSANPACSGLLGDCCPTPDGSFLGCCEIHEGSAAKRWSQTPQRVAREIVQPPMPVIMEPEPSLEMVKGECKAYLDRKGLAGPHELASKLRKCPLDSSAAPYTPEPASPMPGVSDTTSMQCQYNAPSENSICCGWRPHFNWVVSTCENNPRIPNPMFCRDVPKCAREPKLNYVAAYQFNGSHFILLDDSSAGTVSAAGIAGRFEDAKGWEAAKNRFRWKGGEGDWPTKYAPWGEGPKGPRGITPPGALWILSAEDFFYGGFYLLSQLNINTQGTGQHGINCWTWEFDAVEGTMGWSRGDKLPGNLNQNYATSNAKMSGCMPVAGTAAQTNGLRRSFHEPSGFKSFCAKNPNATGCQPWLPGEGTISWNGGHLGSDRFENLPATPYVFAVVLDQQGYWVYRWRPDAAGATGWPGVSRHGAARVLPARPAPIRQPSGLETDVRGDVSEAVILLPSLPPEAACLRSSVEAMDWNFGASALGAIRAQLGEDARHGPLDGAQNWWANFADTRQNQGYPLSIAGVTHAKTQEASYDCNKPSAVPQDCGCRREVMMKAKAEVNAPSQGHLRPGEKVEQDSSPQPASAPAPPPASPPLAATPSAPAAAERAAARAGASTFWLAAAVSVLIALWQGS